MNALLPFSRSLGVFGAMQHLQHREQQVFDGLFGGRFSFHAASMAWRVGQRLADPVQVFSKVTNKLFTMKIDLEALKKLVAHQESGYAVERHAWDALRVMPHVVAEVERLRKALEEDRLAIREYLDATAMNATSKEIAQYRASLAARLF